MKRHLLTLLFFFLLLDSSLSISLPLAPTLEKTAGKTWSTVENDFKRLFSREETREATKEGLGRGLGYASKNMPEQPGVSPFRCGGFHNFLSPTQGRNWFSDRTSLTYRFDPKIGDPFAQVLRNSFRRSSQELSLPLTEKRYDEYDYADITIELYNFPDNMVVGDSRIVELIPSNLGAAVGRRVGYIRLDGNKNWGVLNIDIDTVVMHQLGHLLGLSHSSDIIDSVMNPNIWSGKPRKVFSIGEKQQIKQVYSPNGNGNGVGSSP